MSLLVHPTGGGWPGERGPGHGGPGRGALDLAPYVGLGLLVGVLLAGAALLVGPVAPLALVGSGAGVVLAWRRPDLVVVAAVLALPLGQLAVGPVDLVQLCTALVAVAVLAPAAGRAQWRPPPWPVAVPLVAFPVLAAAATPRARDTDLAFRLDVQLLLLVLLTLAVVTGLRTPAQVHAAVVALVAAGGAVSVWALAESGPTESHYGGGVVTGRAVGIFAQPNELGLFSGVLLVIAVGIGLSATTRALRWGSLGGAALLLGALGVSLSRGAWIGAVVGLVALAVLVPGTRRALSVLGATGLVLGAALGALGVGPVAEVGERLGSLGGASNPYDQRPLIWAEALRLVGEAPLLGHGPGGFTAVAASDALRVGTFLEVEHAHNLLLNVAVEFGLLGLLALLGLIAGLALLVWNHRAAGAERARGTWLPGVLTAALVVVLAHGVVDYPLRNPTVLTTIWLVLSVLVAAATVRTAPVDAAERHG